jgi:hypothetical protein
MALFSLWLRDRQSMRKWRPHSKRLFAYWSFRGVNRMLPCSMSFVDVMVLNHQVLRASVGCISSSRKQDVCVKAWAQDDRVWQMHNNHFTSSKAAIGTLPRNNTDDFKVVIMPSEELVADHPRRVSTPSRNEVVFNSWSGVWESGQRIKQPWQ